MKEPFKIIFEDEYIIVIDKIAKILVQPSKKNDKYTLTTLLEKYIGKKVYPCHRLDRETTGLILYAKDRNTQNLIMEQFRRKEVKKKYIGFLKGKLKNKKGVLEGYIIDREGEQFGEKPKKAKTIYNVLKELDSFSIVELSPITGRTNQLRIQFAKLGNPILGERKYAYRKDFKVNFKRLALHAFFLSLIHPVANRRITFKIDLAKDMKNFIETSNISIN